jgi:hypothetical protein
MTQPTPYEKQLELLAKEATQVGDSTTVERITTMIQLVRSGQYRTLQEHFPFLRPIYRVRLGVPPASRAEDEASGRTGTPR